VENFISFVKKTLFIHIASHLFAFYMLWKKLKRLDFIEGKYIIKQKEMLE